MVDTNIKHGAFVLKQNNKYLIFSALRSQQVQVELKDSINVTYGILDNIFQI